MTYTIKGAASESKIMLGESVTQLEKYIAGRKYVIVTDEQVAKFHRRRFPGDPVIVIGVGEGIKTLATVEKLYQKFLDFELDRSALVVAIGGGIVCDLAGFAASTYLRGIAFGFVPTTLLAQVDASMGGKNGVNFRGYKNMIGTFNQPEFVLADFSLLKTLDPAQLGCGFAEAIKHGTIADRSLFTFMEDHAESIKKLEPESLERIVNDSMRIKATIVNQDEKETGERRKLNFGHTFGHAVEKTLGLPHGQAIAIGMAAALRLSTQLAGFSAAEAARLRNLLAKFDLPVNIAADPIQIKDALRKDKKRSGECIKFVLLEEIGTSVIKEVSLQQLEVVIDDLCESC